MSGGTRSQNGALLYPYSPAYIASERGGACVTVPAITRTAKSCAPACKSAPTAAKASVRFGTSGAFTKSSPEQELGRSA